jgi:hypothetical protein
MSDELNAIENYIEEVLIELMVDKVVSVGIQSSSTRGLQASLSTTRRSRPSRAAAEKRTKHQDDLANVKLIPSILAGTVNCDSVPREFNYTLVTMYLPKGIHTGKPQLDKIMTLKINEFNLGDRKNFSMLTPHRYFNRNKGKNSRIIPQPWTMDLAQSTIPNMMKIPHFGRHQEVNGCVKLLLLSFHGGYLWLDKHITVDLVLIHRITGLNMQGPDPQDFYLGKAVDCALA